MTTYASPVRTESRPVVPAGVAATLVAAACTTAFAHDWVEVAVSVTGMVLIAAVIFGVVVPRALRKESAGGTALGLSIPALLLAMPAFWTGLPLVLGVAGVIVGNAGRQARSGAGACIAGLALGALAVLGYVAIYVMSGIAGDTGFLFE